MPSFHINSILSKLKGLRTAVKFGKLIKKSELPLGIQGDVAKTEYNSIDYSSFINNYIEKAVGQQNDDVLLNQNIRSEKFASKGSKTMKIELRPLKMTIKNSDKKKSILIPFEFFFIFASIDSQWRIQFLADVLIIKEDLEIALNSNLIEEACRKYMQLSNDNFSTEQQSIIYLRGTEQLTLIIK